MSAKQVIYVQYESFSKKQRRTAINNKTVGNNVLNYARAAKQLYQKL